MKSKSYPLTIGSQFSETDFSVPNETDWIHRPTYLLIEESTTTKQLLIPDSSLNSEEKSYAQIMLRKIIT